MLSTVPFHTVFYLSSKLLQLNSQKPLTQIAASLHSAVQSEESAEGLHTLMSFSAHNSPSFQLLVTMSKFLPLALFTSCLTEKWDHTPFLYFFVSLSIHMISLSLSICLYLSLSHSVSGGFISHIVWS